jgi:hypothetical protein
VGAGLAVVQAGEVVALAVQTGVDGDPGGVRGGRVGVDGAEEFAVGEDAGPGDDAAQAADRRPSGRRTG